jgi:hypothetical protein
MAATSALSFDDIDSIFEPPAPKRPTDLATSIGALLDITSSYRNTGDYDVQFATDRMNKLGVIFSSPIASENGVAVQLLDSKGDAAEMGVTIGSLLLEVNTEPVTELAFDAVIDLVTSAWASLDKCCFKFRRGNHARRVNGGHTLVKVGFRTFAPSLRSAAAFTRVFSASTAELPPQKESIGSYEERWWVFHGSGNKQALCMFNSRQDYEDMLVKTILQGHQRPCGPFGTRSVNSVHSSMNSVHSSVNSVHSSVPMPVGSTMRCSVIQNSVTAAAKNCDTSPLYHFEVMENSLSLTCTKFASRDEDELRLLRETIDDALSGWKGGTKAEGAETEGEKRMVDKKKNVDIEKKKGATPIVRTAAQKLSDAMGNGLSQKFTSVTLSGITASWRPQQQKQREQQKQHQQPQEPPQPRRGRQYRQQLRVLQVKKPIEQELEGEEEEEDVDLGWGTGTPTKAPTKAPTKGLGLGSLSLGLGSSNYSKTEYQSCNLK